MTLTVEIEGKAADRFRAYAATKLTRKPSAADHYKRSQKKLPAFDQGARIRYDGEKVVLEGPVTGDMVKIDGKDAVLTKVVFYRGPVAAETVVGSVEVGGAGAVEIKIVAPVEVSAEDLVVDE